MSGPSADRVDVKTTLWELANTIRDVSSNDAEAFAVLEMMLTEGRISVCASAA